MFTVMENISVIHLLLNSPNCVSGEMFDTVCDHLMLTRALFEFP